LFGFFASPNAVRMSPPAASNSLLFDRFPRATEVTKPTPDQIRAAFTIASMPAAQNSIR
jgi:hypothetical protein